MNLDLMVLGLVLFFALLGAMVGGLIQLSHLAAVVVGGLLARPAGLWLGPWMARRLGTPEIVGFLAASVLAFFVGYGLVQFALRGLIRRTVKNRALSRADRGLGFVLGAVKSAAIVYVLLSALIFFEKPFARVSHRHFETRGSKIASLVRAHDLFTDYALPGTAGLSELARVGSDPAAAARLAQDPGFQKLVHEPRIQALIHDPALQRALRSGDAITLLRNDRVVSLLTDASIRDQLTAVGERLSTIPASKGLAR